MNYDSMIELKVHSEDYGMLSLKYSSYKIMNHRYYNILKDTEVEYIQHFKDYIQVKVFEELNTLILKGIKELNEVTFIYEGESNE
jgi:hypothetical protein